MNPHYSPTDLQIMGEEPTDGDMSEWEEAKAIVEKAEQMLENSPRRGSDLWLAIGVRANRRWEKRDAKIEKILKNAEYIVWHNQCPGCGEYSERGRIHNRPICRADARYDG